MFDKVFRILLLIAMAGFLLVAYCYSENGRYAFHREMSAVIDTRTGTIYFIHSIGSETPTVSKIGIEKK